MLPVIDLENSVLNNNLVPKINKCIKEENTQENGKAGNTKKAMLHGQARAVKVRQAIQKAHFKQNSPDSV